MSLSVQRQRYRKRRLSQGMSLIEAADAKAREIYDGERLKFAKEGPYYWHPKSVARAMHTPDEKVVALLHDAIELIVKRDLGNTLVPVRETDF